MKPVDPQYVKVHSRNILVESYSAGSGRMIFTASLVEKRLADYYLSTGELEPAGDLHNLSVRLEVKIPEMLIEEIETEMHAVPRDECRDILHAFDKIKGMRIEAGFSSKIKEILSGVNGCTHLTHLIITAAPAALQGMWAERSRTKQTGINYSRLKKMSAILIDTCWAWRKDGRAAAKLKKAMEQASDNQEQNK